MALTVEITKVSATVLEAIVYSPNCTNVSGYYEEITLWVDDKEVQNFDGVSILPEALEAELSKMGYFGF